MRFRTFRVLCSTALAVLLTSTASAQLNLRPNGMVGDGQPDFVYDPATGNITLTTDGCPGQCNSLNGFQLESASGIFTGDPAMLPAEGLFSVDTDFEISKLAFFGVASLDLGNVVPPGLSVEFLLSDLVTARVNNGLEGFSLTLLPAPSTGVDAAIAAVLGDIVTHQFQPAGGEDPLGFGAPEWSDLVFSGDMGQPPALPPLLTENGLFTWDTTGSPLGDYTATATVSNAGGSAMATLSITLRVPEPSSAVLLLLPAVFGVHFFRPGRK
jgi:hypothetical protein